MNTEPAKLHEEHVDKQITVSGITVENVSKIKQADKAEVAKLERLESVLDKGEEKGVLTEEHIKLKAAITAHKAT